MSSSLVRLTASSNAKFGAAVNALGWEPSSCIHRDGFCMNEIGLISAAGVPSMIGMNTPTIRPMSW